MNLHALSGMRDYLGASGEELHGLMETALEVFRTAGYREIATPVLEDARLFDRSLGTDTDIVSREMYTVEQTEDRVVALRPENTAGVARAVIQHGLLSRHNQLKLCYRGGMFRHERPQSGRLRQFHQVGVECFGRADPLVDAEVIQLGRQFLREAGVTGTRLLVNSIGCPACRPDYLDRLSGALEPHRDELCEDCQRRLETNPLRVLDCDREACRSVYEEQAPSILEALCEDCDRHFGGVRNFLEEMEVEHEVDPTLVRGLDYYRRTAFEFVSTDLGSQDAVLAGGRYDGLVEELGGEPAPAVGFAAGLERIMLLRGGEPDEPDVETRTDCFVVNFDDASLRAVLPLALGLRNRSHPTDEGRIRVELGEPNTSLRSQLRRANRYEAAVVLLLGEDEREAGTVTLKRLDSGDQEDLEYPPVGPAADRVIEALEAVRRTRSREDASPSGGGTEP